MQRACGPWAERAGTTRAHARRAACAACTPHTHRRPERLLHANVSITHTGFPQELSKRAAAEGCEVVVVSAKVEAELNELPKVKVIIRSSVGLDYVIH